MAGSLLLCFLAGAESKSDLTAPASDPAAAIVPGAPAETTHLAWSRPVDGIRVRLVCKKMSVRVGQSVELEFRLENCGERTESVPLPMVRPTIVPAAQAGDRPAGSMSGDLLITAEPVGRDRQLTDAIPVAQRMMQYGAFPVPSGSQVWISVGATPPSGGLQANPVRFLGGNRGGAGEPMMHLHETAQFPALNRPGRYLVTATFTATDQGDSPFATRVAPVVTGADRQQWVGQVQSPPIELEVLPAEPAGK